jgi:hypothetical protein
MDRASERFTAHTRYVTFFAGFAVALLLQLDTAALVSRLSTDDQLRTALFDLAQKQTAQAAAGTQQNAPAATDQKSTPGATDRNSAPTANSPAPASAAVAVQLTDIDKQNLKDLMVNNVIGIPESLSDWLSRWHWDNCLVKLLGILLTALLLSLGAPFWYGALQNLLRLRSALATKDDQQREQRQLTGQPTPAAGPVDAVVLSDERGELTAAA